MEGSKDLKTLIQKKFMVSKAKVTIIIRKSFLGKLTKAILWVFMTRCFTDMCDVYIMGTFTFDKRHQKITGYCTIETAVKD